MSSAETTERVRLLAVAAVPPGLVAVIAARPRAAGPLTGTASTASEGVSETLQVLGVRSEVIHTFSRPAGQGSPMDSGAGEGRLLLSGWLFTGERTVDRLLVLRGGRVVPLDEVLAAAPGAIAEVKPAARAGG